MLERRTFGRVSDSLPDIGRFEEENDRPTDTDKEGQGRVGGGDEGQQDLTNCSCATTIIPRVLRLSGLCPVSIFHVTDHH